MTEVDYKDALLSLSVMMKADRAYVEGSVDDAKLRKGALYIIDRVDEFLKSIDCKI